DRWSGKSELWRGISDFRATGDGMEAVAGADTAHKRLRHAPGATLTIRYRLSQFWPGDPKVTGANEYRPIIRPTYFHISGWTALARPAWSLATPASVSFKNFPAKWGLASDLQHAIEGRPSDLLDVLRSITVGGDFRVVKAGKLRVAVRGSWSFSESDFVKRLQPIRESHRKFWGDPEE